MLDKHSHGDLRGFEWHYLNRLSHSELLSLNGHADSVHSAAFGPDGKPLTWAEFDEKVKALVGYALHSVAYSPDGKRLASAS